MLGRRLLAICRRMLVVLFATVAILSITGPSRGVQEDAGGDSHLSYTACGKKHLDRDDILSRLSERIKCRTRLGKSSRTLTNSTSSDANFTQPMFLTHDLFGSTGLGNFMFMCAAVFGLAKTTGRKPVFVDDHHHMAVFEPKFPLVDNLSQRERAYIPQDALSQNVIRLEAAGIYDTTVLQTLDFQQKTAAKKKFPKLFTLHGYVQSWKYFDRHRQLIQQQFTFSSLVFKQALAVLTTAVTSYTKTVKQPPTSLIGVHVRRGDILRPFMKKYGHTAASKSYLTKMIANLTVTYEPALFIVLSNDLKYCKRLLSDKPNVVFVSGNPPEVDMAILTLMDHLILTVGTFGWWGAYLSDAQDVFYYRNWPTYGSTMDKEYHKGDYFLDRWKSSE